MLHADQVDRRPAGPGLRSGQDHQAGDVGIVLEQLPHVGGGQLLVPLDAEGVVAPEPARVGDQPVEAGGEGRRRDDAADQQAQRHERPGGRRGRPFVAGQREPDAGCGCRARRAPRQRLTRDRWPRRSVVRSDDQRHADPGEQGDHQREAAEQQDAGVDLDAEVGLDPADEAGREEAGGGDGQDRAEGGPGDRRHGGTAQGLARELTARGAHRLQRSAFDVGEPDLPAEDLPEGDHGADGRDGSHQPDAASLRVDGPTDARGDDPAGFHGEGGPVGEPVELGAQLFRGGTGLQANGHDRLAGHDRFGVEEPGRDERGGVAVLEGLGRIDDADQLGVEGVPLGWLLEEAAPVELLARPAHQREPVAELCALLVHEPSAGDELVRIGRIGGAPGDQARRRQPGAGQGDGPPRPRSTGPSRWRR